MKKDILYRKAQIGDATKLSVLYKQVYIQTYGIEGVSDEFANFTTKQFSVERIENTIRQHPECIIVATYNSNLVGVAEIEFLKKSPVGDLIAPELNKLYILEWFCGMGIGHQLLGFAEDIVRSKGETEMWLWVLESNARAIRFYEKQNYKCIGNAAFQMETNSYDNKVMLRKFQ